MQVLAAHLATSFDALRPGNQAQVRGAALVAGIALPVRERRVERPRPPGRVVVEAGRGTELVDARQVRLDRVGDPVEELVLVERAVRAAFGARTVVGGDDDDRVVELAGLLEVIDQPADLVIGVGDEPGIDLRHPREQTLLVGAQGVPRLHVVELWPRLTLRSGCVGLTVGVDLGERCVSPGRDRAPSDGRGSPVGSPRSPCRSGLGTDPSTRRTHGAAHGRTRARGRGRTACLER